MKVKIGIAAGAGLVAGVICILVCRYIQKAEFELPLIDPDDDEMESCYKPESNGNMNCFKAEGDAVRKCKKSEDKENGDLLQPES